MKTGVYPGSFNPPTVAHLAIAAAARDSHQLDRVDLCVSTSALAKEDVVRPLFTHRVEVLEAAVAELDWLTVRVTDLQLLADIAAGYEVLIMGADKWTQIQDPIWYGNDPGARDAAMAALPTVAVTPREGHEIPAEMTLPVDPSLVANVSSTAARSGRATLMVPAAKKFATKTGAWLDPDRYETWLQTQRPE